MTQDFLAQEEEKSVIERQRQRKQADRLEKKRNTSLASIICNEIARMDLQVGLLHEFPTSTWGQTSTAALATLRGETEDLLEGLNCAMSCYFIIYAI